MKIFTNSPCLFLSGIVLSLVLAGCGGAQDKPQSQNQDQQDLVVEQVEYAVPTDETLAQFGPNPYLLNAPEVSRIAARDFKLALGWLDSGKTAQAEEKLLSLIDEYPELSGSVYNLARLRVAQDRYDDAMELVNTALERNSLNFEAMNLRAYLLRESGDFNGAEEQYLKMMDLWGGYLAAYKNLGILYDLYMGEELKALPYYEKFNLFAEEPSKQVNGWIVDIERRNPEYVAEKQRMEDARRERAAKALARQQALMREQGLLPPEEEEVQDELISTPANAPEGVGQADNSVSSDVGKSISEKSKAINDASAMSQQQVLDDEGNAINLLEGETPKQAKKRLAKEKKAEEKRLAKERKAEEKQRKAEEKQRKAEEKRLAKEKAEEEKRLAKERAAAEKAAVKNEKSSNMAEEGDTVSADVESDEDSKRLAEEKARLKQEAEQKQKAEEERQAKEKAEQQRLANEAQKRAEAEKIRIEEEKRIAAEKKAEESRIAKEKAEAEKQRKEELELQAMKKAEEDKRIAAEKLAEEKRIAEEEARKKKVEDARRKNESEEEAEARREQEEIEAEIRRMEEEVEKEIQRQLKEQRGE